MSDFILPGARLPRGDGGIRSGCVPAVDGPIVWPPPARPALPGFDMPTVATAPDAAVRMTAIGVDFGTTNSVVSLLEA